MSLPLEGIRVLDLSRLLPGGFCSLLLADFGADVVKVEDTGMGDYVRWSPPYYEGADDSASCWGTRMPDLDERFRSLSTVRTPNLWTEIETRDHQPGLREAGVDRHQISQTPGEQQRADDEDERQRHLDDDEGAPQSEALP